MMRQPRLQELVRPPTLLFLVVILLWSLAGCQLASPPRLATATARSAAPPTPEPPPLQLTVPPATETSTTAAENESSSGTVNPVLTVWVDENSAAHTAILEQMQQEFSAQTNIDLDLVQVSPMLLPDLVSTAVLSDTLPDLLLFPLAYAPGWAQQGAFNTDAHAAALENLDAATFDPAAVELVTQNDLLIGLPSDGFHQLLVYRSDLFAAQGLAAPDNYDAMLAAAAATTDRENARAGWVIPTESNLVTTHQAFEQIALANGCDLIDDKGEVQLLEPSCREALNFYYNIVHGYSPFGVQTDTSARNAYLAGRTGMIMGPPSVLPLIAGLDETAVPSCTPCLADPQFLVENTGILSALNGRGTDSPAAYSDIRLLGITRAAPVENALLFVDFWFNEGYDDWLSVQPEMKVPLRWGTGDDPRRFIDSWGSGPLVPDGPSLESLYGAEVVAQLRDGVADAPRWGIPRGHGTLITQLNEELLFSVILQEMLSGYFGPDRTIIELYVRVTELIPNYAYPVDPAVLEPESDQ